MTRLYWPREVAILLCVIASSLPLSELIQGGPVASLLTGALVVGVIGILQRLFSVRPLLGLALQICGAAIFLAIFLISRGVSLTPSGLNDVIESAQTSVNSSIAPLPNTTPVVAMTLLGALLIGCVVDFVGATSRMPLMAAIPMAAPFILATTAIGATLSARYFIFAALAWAALLLTHSLSEGQSLRDSLASAGPTALIFAVVGALAVGAALAIAPNVPHRDTPALAQGSAGGMDTSVNFSKSLDLSKSLKSKNSAPVLVYQTPEVQLEPLRVTTSSKYDDGVWQAQALDGPFVEEQHNSRLANPGLSDRTPTRTGKLSVTMNGMQAPLVATPSMLQVAEFGEGNESFRMTVDSQVPVLKQQSAAYSVLYRRFLATAHPSSNTNATTATPTVTKDDLDTSVMSAADRSQVDALVNASGGNGQTPFQSAIRVQRYLRTSPDYKYSLTLAPTKTENGEKLTPLANFLETKQGYCTQFASAMVMAARTQGIPARMAIGFLPGSPSQAKAKDPNETVYNVHASDAHAWAELYFPGMGWTRFDPTPGSRSGTAPPYAPDTADDSSSPTSSPSPSTSTATSTPPSQTSTPTQSTPPPSTESSTEAPKPQEPSKPSHVLRNILWTLLGVVVVAALLSILPLAGRRERDRVLRNASTDAEKDEGVWHSMSGRMRDLGMPLPSGLSPAATAEEFARRYPNASPELKDAVARAAQHIEGSRYAATRGRDLGGAADRVTRTASGDSNWFTRLRAELFPRTGVEFFKNLFRSR